LGKFLGCPSVEVRKKGKKNIWILTGLIYAIFIHGLYDFLLMQQKYDFLKIFAFVVLYFAVRLSFKAIKAYQSISPFNHDNHDDEEWTFKE